MISDRAGMVGVFALLAALGAAGTAGTALGAAPPQDHVVQRTHEAMGTTISLQAWGEDDEKIVSAFADAFAEFDRIDALMTTWTETSDIARINGAAGGKPVKVSGEVIVVLQAAMAASKLTSGAFDITVGVFFGLWKFDEDKDGTLPEFKLIEARVKLVGWKDVVINAKKKTVKLKRKGMKITLGGIAKGYAVDRAVAILRKKGLVDFVVQAGGDMFVAGRHGDRKWRVGIRDPRGGRTDHFAYAEVEDMTFSTSGDYERFVIKDGKRYHHILDPKTGFPADKCRSVTVMAKDALTAEGLTKGIFILGPEAGMKLVEALPDVEAVVVDAKNQVHVSSGLKDGLKINHPPTDGI
jgi:FAD:protein FMN transferase